MSELIGLRGLYQFEVAKVDAAGCEIPGSRRIAVPWFENLITNVGLDFLSGNAGDALAYCRLGTSNTVPAFTDVALGDQKGASNTAGASDVSGVSGDGTYLFRRVTRQFAAGSVSGHNLNEVAMGGAATGNVFSRALLKDAGGVPTTITLAADEILDVIYELRAYVANTTTTANITVDGVATAVSMFPMGWPSADVWVRTAARLGISMLNTSGNTSDRNLTLQEANLTIAAAALTGLALNYKNLSTYVAGSYRRTYQVDLPIAEGNFATGIGSLVFNAQSGNQAIPSGFGQWGMSFTPKIAKTNAKTANLVFGLSFGRYAP